MRVNGITKSTAGKKELLTMLMDSRKDGQAINMKVILIRNPKKTKDVECRGSVCVTISKYTQLISEAITIKWRWWSKRSKLIYKIKFENDNKGSTPEGKTSLLPKT